MSKDRESGGLSLSVKSAHVEMEASKRFSFTPGDFPQGWEEWPLTQETNLELGILVCENCGKLIKFQDAPCTCGNREYFIVLDDCSLLLCMDAYQDTEGWPSEHLALSA